METSKLWKEQQGRLRKEMKFKNFENAISYINAVAKIAEKYNHHPTITNTYNKVTLELWTHDENEITDLDWQLTKVIDELDEDFK
ncbi:MAG: pterin-4-alpha-carbinolamine dehydratase [Flavobacteriaceae bacterium]|nr:pterin-4-alpha-carbinolamine dehydratase [Flavobacteriaceae bacterium]